MFVRFLRDRKGGVAPLLALASLPLIGSVGAAVDYSRANSARSAMQAAADAAALALARDSRTNIGGDPSAAASNYFAANFTRSEVQVAHVTATASSAATQHKMTVSATGTIKTMLLGVLGFSSVTLTVNSGAASTFDGLGCVLALDKSASGAFSGQGSTSVTLKGCSLYVNSKSTTAVGVGGSAKVSALSVGVVGGVAPGSYGLTADYGIRAGILPVTDPYKDVELPSAGACTENNFKATASITIDPGVYCGGIAIHAGAIVKLNPGIYYLDGGDLTVNGSASLLGTGVTLVFTSKNRNSWATASISGNATIDLSPPNFGPTAGIVMFGDRRIPTGTDFNLTGGTSQSFAGAVYLPTATINFSGGNTTSASCTQVIGNIVNFSGNSALALNCSSYQIKPFGMWTSRITS
jgi:Flp pilus assembly protein TadG